MVKFDGGHVWLAAIGGAFLAADYHAHGSVWRSALFIAAVWLACRVGGYFSRATTLAHLEEKGLGGDTVSGASPWQLETGRFLRRHGSTIALVAAIALLVLNAFLPDDGYYIDWDGHSNPLVCH